MSPSVDALLRRAGRAERRRVVAWLARRRAGSTAGRVAFLAVIAALIVVRQ